MTKIAFYDFDDTLLPRDSMARLIIYCLKKKPWLFYRLFPILFLGILYGLKLIKFKPLKQQILFPLNYLSEDDLKDFYHTCLIPNYYDNVVSTIYKHHQDGYLIFLVSASPEAYLKYTDLPVDVIIGTQMAYENGRYHNQMISLNCKSEEKVRRIQEVLKKQNVTIDYDHSYGYSDSVTDLPMLKLVKNRIRIEKGTGKMTTFD